MQYTTIPTAPETIEAIQLPDGVAEVTLTYAEGAPKRRDLKAKGGAGDWLVIQGDGAAGFLPHDTFSARYIPAPAPPPPYGQPMPPLPPPPVPPPPTP